MNRFRILSLDGGGVKGAFSASILASLERLTGKSVVDHFDLITGTSTGGLIALGLGLGSSAEEILEFYVERGPGIFPSGGLGRVVHAVKHAFRPKYSQQVLSDSLTEFFGDKRLGESSCRLVIPTFDGNAGQVQLFKTAHHSRFVHDYQLPAREVAMATAAAPTYFPAFRSPQGQVFLDGGIWANCPIVVGLIEAVFVLGKPPSCIDVLSIGTTTAPFDVPERRRLGGLLAWNHQVVDLLIQAQIDGALAQARIITGKRATRIDATTRPGRFSMDDARQIDALRGLGAKTAQENFDEISARFFDTPVDPFEPCYQLSEIPCKPRIPSYVPRRRRRKSLGTAHTGFPRDNYRVIDISVSGALLETPGEMPIGNEIDLDLQLEDGTTARVSGRVVRNQQPQWGVTAGVGVQFTDYQGDSRDILQRYVAAEQLAAPMMH